MNAIPKRIIVQNEFTTVNPNQPIRDTDIYQWMSNWYVSSIPFSTRTSVISAYLAGRCGFDQTRHCLTTEDLETLSFCVSHWFESRAWYCPQKAEALFNKFISPQDRDFIKVEDVTDHMKELVKQAGWIYSCGLTNDNTYFSIKGKKVFVKAQQILASRYLCDLGEG